MRASPTGAAAVLSVLHLICAARLASAQDAVPPAPPADLPVAPPPTPPEPPPPPDPNHLRREALFDIAFAALASGRLELAEQSFAEAAALPGDPARAAVAASFADRTRRLILQRALTRSASPAADAPSPPSPPSPPSAPRSPSAPDPSDSARYVVPILSTVMGLSVYGWAFPSALHIDPGDSTRAFIGVYMLTAGASFVTAYAATRNADVTPAQANLAYYGATRGLWHGVLLSAALFGNTGPDRRFQLWAGSLLLGSVGEMTGGYLLAGRKRMTAGEARTLAVWGDFGLGWGLSLGAVLGLHHDDRSEDAQASGMGAMGVVGSAAGLASGYFLSRGRGNTWGDGEVFRTAGLLGTWLGVTTSIVADWNPDRAYQEKRFFFSLMAGSALGLWTGDRLVRRTNFTVGQAVLVDLSTVAGALGVAGVAYLVSTDTSDNVLKGFAVASMLGGALGFGVAYTAFYEDAAAAPRGVARGSGSLPTVAVIPTLGRDGGRGLALAGSY